MGRGLLQTLCERGELDRALDVLFRAETAPPPSAYLSLLKACTKGKALAQAKRVLSHLALHSVHLTGLLGDYLVLTLANCGAIEDALHTFQTLPWRTVFSWTALISAYANCGCGREALRMYQLMQEDHVQPSHYTFVALFKACGSIPDLVQGKKLHADARNEGLVASNVFVGNTLVSMYGKCGAIVEAENVFGALSCPDLVSWNAMLTAYVEQGQGEKALRLYRQMQEEGVSPDQLTFVITLQACGTFAEKEETHLMERQLTKVMSLEIGYALHADLFRRKGFASDIFVGSALVSMYGKCGAIAEAEDTFSASSYHDGVSWNAMLSAYIEHGQGEKALLLYTQMQQEGVSLNQLTFVIAVQACATLAEKAGALFMDGRSAKVVPLEIGQALHADAHKKGLASDVIVGNSLVSMYGKCGAMLESTNVFGALSQRTVVSWNAMLSAYVEQGQGEKALQLYRQMLEEGMSLNQLTSVIALQACVTLVGKREAPLVEGRSAKMMPLEIGRAIHAQARRKGFALDVLVSNTLVSVYGKLGATVEAEYVFTAVSQHTLVSWNAMISAYAEQCQVEKALQLYPLMQQEGVSPDQATFVVVLQACANLAKKEEALLLEGRTTIVMALEVGQALHADARKKGFASDVFVGNTLVSMYGKCGATAASEDALNALSWCTVVSWNAMLSAYVEQSQGEKALRLYRQMQKQCVGLDHVTLVCILQACSAIGGLEKCRQCHFDIVSVGFDQILSVATTLIDTYGSCAGMIDAQAVFDTLSEPDNLTWNVCISGHAGEGNSLASLDMLERLILTGFKPDEDTLFFVLSACSHTGLVVEGLEFCVFMSRSYGITPCLKHYSSMLDLFGRAGDFRRVENMLSKMPMQANLNTWLCLLGVCRTHGNVEMAKQAFDHAVNLQPKQATAYVLMSNVYADVG